MTKTTRKPEWDFVKGILIVFVVWGHICSYISGEYDKNLLTAIIRLYQMPMFILVSGYFQRKCNSSSELKKQIAKTFKTLVIPYAVWVFIASVANFVSVYIFNGDKINSIRQLVGMVLGNANILWYLGCLIAFQICYALFSWLSVYWGKIVWILSFLILLACPIDIWYTGFLWPFFLLGRFLNEFKLMETKGKKFKLLPLLICCVVLIVASQFYPTSLTFYNRKNFLLEDGIDGMFSQLLFVFVRYALYGIVTVVFFLTFFALYRKFYNKLIVRFVCYIGQRTLGIFIIHIVVLYYFFKPFIFNITGGKGILYELPGVRFYIVATLLTIITTAVCILCSNAIEKNQFCARILLGKKANNTILKYQKSDR